MRIELTDVRIRASKLHVHDEASEVILGADGQKGTVLVGLLRDRCNVGVWEHREVPFAEFIAWVEKLVGGEATIPGRGEQPAGAS